MTHIAQHIRKELLARADEQTRLSSLRFFKEEVKTYGVQSALVTQIAKNALRHLKKATKEDIFALCEQLWQSGLLEEGGVACILAHAQAKAYAPEDFAIFERWLASYVNNWASCDTLCNHSLGTFLTMYPGHLNRLKGWTASPNRWLRRGAAVSLIIPARKGLFLEEVLDIAESLLADKDDLVQKGYGWMLKAASQAEPQAVFDYLMTRKTTMPRTAFRYALEKLPKEWRAQAMAK